MYYPENSPDFVNHSAFLLILKGIISKRHPVSFNLQIQRIGNTYM